MDYSEFYKFQDKRIVQMWHGDKKICNKQGICRVKKVSSTLEKEIKDAILARATMMQKGIWADNRKKYQKERGSGAATWDERQNRD